MRLSTAKPRNQLIRIQGTRKQVTSIYLAIVGLKEHVSVTVPHMRPPNLEILDSELAISTDSSQGVMLIRTEIPVEAILRVLENCSLLHLAGNLEVVPEGTFLSHFGVDNAIFFEQVAKGRLGVEIRDLCREYGATVTFEDDGVKITSPPGEAIPAPLATRLQELIRDAE